MEGASDGLGGGAGEVSGGPRRVWEALAQGIDFSWKKTTLPILQTYMVSLTLYCLTLYRLTLYRLTLYRADYPNLLS